jgi:hypothetical protein
MTHALTEKNDTSKSSVTIIFLKKKLPCDPWQSMAWTIWISRENTLMGMVIWQPG